MSALTEARDTREIAAGGVHYTREFTVASGSTVYAGGITAINSSGKAIPATSAGAITVVGRAENTAAAGETVTTEEKGEWIRPWKETEAAFLFKEGKPIKREITDFTYGLVIPSNLMPRHISGGIILEDTFYEMRE